MFNGYGDQCTIEEIFDDFPCEAEDFLTKNTSLTDLSSAFPSTSEDHDQLDPEQAGADVCHSTQPSPDCSRSMVDSSAVWSVDGGSPSSSSVSSSRSPAIISRRASPTMTASPLRKKRRRPSAQSNQGNCFLKTCAVCGDRANGYHYDSPSCNSCRVFFRRTVLAKQELRCRRLGNCFQTLQRNQYLLCRYCRFDKCIKVGMNAKAVTGTAGEQISDTNQTVSADSLQVAVQVPSTLRSPADKVSGLIKYLEYLEGRHQAVRQSEYCPRTNSGIDIEYLLTTPSSLGMNYKPMEGWPLPNDPRLFDCQYSLDGHIEHRARVTLPDEYQSKSTYKEWMYCDGVYAIDCIKTFDFFNQLDHADKVALIKHVATIASVFTGYFYSIQNKSLVTLYPDGRTPYKIHEVSSRVTNFTVKKTMQEMEMDQPTYVLLKAIYICDPVVLAAENLSDRGRKILTAERELMAKALMSYLMAKYSVPKAPVMFTECMNMQNTMSVQISKLRSLDTVLKALNLKRPGSKLGREIGGFM